MKPEKFILKNSSTLLIIPFSAPSLFVSAWIKSGYRSDPSNKSGLNHFIEHLSFRGTKKYPSIKSLHEVLERYGIHSQAFTSQDFIKYWVKSNPKHFKTATEILFERLFFSLFREEDIKQEKEIVKEELRILKSNPSQYIWEIWSENIWQNTPLGRAYIGNEESIKNFTGDDIKIFIEKKYASQNITYVIAGDINSSEAFKLFNSKYGLGKEENIYQNLVFKRKNPIKIINQNQETVTVAYGFLTCSFLNKDKFPLEIIAAYFSGGWSSVLRRKLSEMGLTYSIETYSYHISDTGYLMILFTALPKNVPKIIEMINKEIEFIKKGKIPNKDFIRAKGYLKGEMVINTETSGDFADWYGYQVLISSKKPLSLASYCQLIDKVSNEEVKFVSKKYFKNKNWYLSAIGKIKKKDIKFSLI